VGGENIEARFVEVTMRLHPSTREDNDPAEWRAEVGFIPSWRSPFPVLLGQLGFLDAFTITVSRTAAALAVESQAVFDERYGVLPA